MHGPGFLHVHVEVAIDHALLTARQILDPELGLVLVPADKGDVLAIGRRLRANRAAISADGCRHFAGCQIVALDGEGSLRGILCIFENRPRCDVARIIHRIAIGRIDGLAQFLLQGVARPLHQLDTAPTRNMVDPDLACAERTLGGEMLLGDDIIAVGRPACLIDEAEILLGQLALVRPIDIHDPDVVAAAPVGGEGDAAAIG